ncbi:type II secretion system F family protein [Corynebacterium caspium]|uniref:type II secretion system F family protein n=1 Tax=Corynebacterium caspium TaxID=234828 RepID=UPI0003658EA0|nr:hypothetical protein [Corynebacterium caspium]WKD58574.1 hypothetical protein CCASP_00730 [Corynebacterium caspium DSM 44850]
MGEITAAAWIIAAIVILLWGPPTPLVRLGLTGVNGVGDRRWRMRLKNQLGLNIAILSAIGGGIILWGRASILISLGIIIATATWRVRKYQQQHLRTGESLSAEAFLAAVVSQLQAGSSPQQAVEIAAETHPCIASQQLLATAYGAAPESRLAALWVAAREHGISIAPLLAAEEEGLKQQRRLAKRIQALLSGPKATAIILAFLPAAGLGLGSAMGAKPIAFLLGGGFGGIALISGIALIAGGLVWSEVLIGRVGGNI